MHGDQRIRPQRAAAAAAGGRGDRDARRSTSPASPRPATRPAWWSGARRARTTSPRSCSTAAAADQYWFERSRTNDGDTGGSDGGNAAPSTDPCPDTVHLRIRRAAAPNPTFTPESSLDGTTWAPVQAPFSLAGTGPVKVGLTYFSGDALPGRGVRLLPCRRADEPADQPVRHDRHHALGDARQQRHLRRRRRTTRSRPRRCRRRGRSAAAPDDDARRRAAAHAGHQRQRPQPRGVPRPDADAAARGPEAVLEDPLLRHDDGRRAGGRRLRPALLRQHDADRSASTSATGASQQDSAGAPRRDRAAEPALPRRSASDGAPCSIYHVPKAAQAGKTLVSVTLPSTTTPGDPPIQGYLMALTLEEPSRRCSRCPTCRAASSSRTTTTAPVTTPQRSTRRQPDGERRAGTPGRCG